jgi:endonuclease III
MLKITSFIRNVRNIRNIYMRQHIKLEHEQKLELFEKQYMLIKEMRQEGRVASNAAVDLLSKDDTVEDLTNLNADQIKENQKMKRYQSLIGLMLSAQTKDTITAQAMKRLRDYGCTVENILQTSNEKLSELIYPVGFYKRKSDFIKRVTKILQDQYDGDIPRTVDEMMKLPGVGPKMAYLCMDSAWNDNVGIGVDTHVRSNHYDLLTFLGTPHFKSIKVG